MNTNKIIARLGLLSLAVISVSAIAAEPVNMEAAKKLAETCQACHGADGNATAPIYPRLAGQYADYLARALHEYRDGGRVNPIMGVYAENLTDQDIKNLAAYFSAMPGKLDDLYGRMQGE
ncbi:MAG TPA: cytochrome c [Dokdonella sp.]|uniref:c-type cytochrome n=1 Tax=Dokdonella sp. TaxID=2291710 RepID=UPI002D809374|nr:cytochrome c [Dokdonella sp.]HET9032468.1 cytochrome c [Dokdonella sp.]